MSLFLFELKKPRECTFLTVKSFLFKKEKDIVCMLVNKVG